MAQLQAQLSSESHLLRSSIAHTTRHTIKHIKHESQTHVRDWTHTLFFDNAARLAWRFLPPYFLPLWL